MVERVKIANMQFSLFKGEYTEHLIIWSYGRIIASLYKGFKPFYEFDNSKVSQTTTHHQGIAHSVARAVVKTSPYVVFTQIKKARSLKDIIRLIGYDSVKNRSICGINYVSEI